MMPLIADRQSIRGRPPWSLGRGGASSNRIGSIRSQRSSLSSQIVSKGSYCRWFRPIRAFLFHEVIQSVKRSYITFYVDRRTVVLR